MSGSESPVPVGEDRRQHLEFIQAVVGRMSSASGLAKGWALTVATAAFGFSATKDAIAVGLLGVAATTAFAVLDARYLLEERKFRFLYRAAAAGAVPVYEMNARVFGDRRDPSWEKECTLWRVSCSWSVLGFYGPVVAVGLGVVLWVKFSC